MPSYTVEVRGPLPAGGLDQLEHLSELKHLVDAALEAGSPGDAVVRAMERVDPGTEVELVYVPDEHGGVYLFWPSGEPLRFERRSTEGMPDEQCFLVVTEACMQRGVPRGEAVFVVGTDSHPGPRWACEHCVTRVRDPMNPV